MFFTTFILNFNVMKKYVLLTLVLTTLFLNTNAQSNWNIGLQWSGYGNYSTYSGGMTEASALFSNNVFGSAQLGVLLRYKLSDHWNLQSGFNFSEIGFSYWLANDYSLLDPMEHFSQLRTGTCLSQVPVMAIYNSKLNCKNVRFIAGVGLAINFIDNNWVSYSSASSKEEGVLVVPDVEMTMQASAQTTTSGSFTWMIGAEKVFKRGNMLSFTFNFNHGFADIANSTVNYSVDGKNYTHSFVNNGSWAGLGLTYYFLPLGSKKIKKLK